MLSKREPRIIDDADKLVNFSVQILGVAKLAAHTEEWRRTRGFMEHPEDLGSAELETTASIWQIEEVRSLEDEDMVRGAILQFHVVPGEVDSSKPTGLLKDIPGIVIDSKLFWRGWSSFQLSKKKSRCSAVGLGSM